MAEGEDDTREHNGRLASWSAKEPTFSFGEEQVGAVEKKLTLRYAYHKALRYAYHRAISVPKRLERISRQN